MWQWELILGWVSVPAAARASDAALRAVVVAADEVVYPREVAEGLESADARAPLSAPVQGCELRNSELRQKLRQS
jgi:hypothetical protein